MDQDDSKMIRLQIGKDSRVEMLPTAVRDHPVPTWIPEVLGRFYAEGARVFFNRHQKKIRRMLQEEKETVLY